MTTPITGAVHLDPATGLLYRDGRLVCRGCGRPSPDRYHNHVCEVKHAAERRRLRTRLDTRPLNQSRIFAGAAS